jgi:dihydrofolate synthase / folylpolyglutamate synthase
MNYEETMKYITETAKFGSKLGLQRTERILQILGDPHKKLKTIHIAGTNGKGSTTAMISRILLESGYKVGMYTSPYLEEFQERIQIDNRNIPKEDLCEIIAKVSKAIDQVIGEGYDHPTEFEIITCAMFLYFYEQKVDYAVIEVGLGGRLDSTNVIIPLVSVITSISYDHMNILGNTLEEIAYEKAGIIKEGVPVVLYPQEEESMKVIEKVSSEKKCKLIKVSNDFVTYLGTEDMNQRMIVDTFRDSYPVNLSLLGKHQLLNCALAVTVAEVLMEQGLIINKQHILSALLKVKWPGRLEIVSKSPMVVIDGAHNIDGIRKLTESIDIYFSYRRLYLILGILADKQVEEMVSTIVPKAYKVIAVTPHSERAELAESLRQIIRDYNSNCEVIEDYEEAYIRALNLCEKEDLLVISGSLYMIGDMRKIIKKHRNQVE